jgi:hypothetical protein
VDDTESPNKEEEIKKSLSAMATEFWDIRGVLMVDFMQLGTTIRS